MPTPDTIALSPRLVARLGELGIAVEPPRAPRVTTEEFFAFWRAVDDATARRDLGLLIGSRALDDGYSVAGAVALHAPNLAKALETHARYKRLTCPERVVIEVGSGEASIHFHWILATSDVPRLLVDGSFASFVALARRGTGGEARPKRIELARRKADVSLLRDHFRCEVRFDAHLDRIVFEESALSLPFVTADAEAFAVLVPGLEAQLVGRSRRRTLRDDVRITIARNMSSGARPTVGHVARRLHLSARTLQRRLGEEQTSYQEQLDEVRRASARRLLANTDLDAVEIAFLLGFEEPSSFARAFRTWERTTPTRFRERARS